MNKIYGSAFITIVLAASVRPGEDRENCDGFPRYRESPKGAEQIIEKVHNIGLAVPYQFPYQKPYIELLPGDLNDIY